MLHMSHRVACAIANTCSMIQAKIQIPIFLQCHYDDYLKVNFVIIHFFVCGAWDQNLNVRVECNFASSDFV